MPLSRDEAVAVLNAGDVLIYPTETFYALGCIATNLEATERIFSIKGRDRSKPLPLIIADWDMAYRFLRLDEVGMSLARMFWPGPLSIVTGVCPTISALAHDASGRSAVRMTPHPVAADLCRAAGVPLVSSSANFSGDNAVSKPSDLDPGLTQRIGVLETRPWPSGGLPSTLVHVLGPGSVQILREGAISISQLQAAGYENVV